MSTRMEIGQMVNGNPTGNFGTDEHADALIEALLHEIGRVYWNINQREWDRYEDPRLFGVCFRRYWWGDEESADSELPNLRFAHSPQEIRWYKYPGRGQSCTINWGANGWCRWFLGALEIIRRNEPEIP